MNKYRLHPLQSTEHPKRVKTIMSKDIIASGPISDPALPPAFRASFLAMQQKSKNNKKKGGIDDSFMSLDSVHSSKTHLSAMASVDDCSDHLNDSFSTFDGNDSFASLGDDDDNEDEAYREGRNQMARQSVEFQSPRRKNVHHLLKQNRCNIKSPRSSAITGGTPLDFIAE